VLQSYKIYFYFIFIVHSLFGVAIREIKIRRVDGDHSVVEIVLNKCWNLERVLLKPHSTTNNFI